MEAFQPLKIGTAPGPSDVYAQMIPSNRDLEIRVLMEPY